MVELIQVFTVERHLYGPDAIPWAALRLPTNVQILQDRYKFSEVRQEPDPARNVTQLVCIGGEFVIEGKPRAVDQLIFEPNVVQFQVNVGSDLSHHLLADLADVMVEIDPNKMFSQDREYTKSYQTVAIARLSVPFDALISDRLTHYLREQVGPKLSHPNASAEIVLERLGWRVTYTTQSTDYLFLPKPLTIEPRAGTRPSDLVYYTVSPTDLETHRKLLEEFEQALGQK